MEKIEFSQEELKTILAVFNKLFNLGNIGLGDATAIVPIAEKIKAKVKEEPVKVTGNNPPVKLN